MIKKIWPPKTLEWLSGHPVHVMPLEVSFYFAAAIVQQQVWELLSWSSMIGFFQV
jgi:hypothetical protein